MATVIEFLGAPGTGKSALAEAVAAVGGASSDAGPLLPTDLLHTARSGRGARPGHLRAGRGGSVGRLVRRVRLRAVRPEERRAALLALEADWTPFLTRCTVAETTDPLYRLYGATWLVASLELRALAAAAPSGHTVLLDEGLLQRTRVILGPSPSDAELDVLIRALPRPDAVVHLVADAEDRSRRLDARAQRRGPTLRHRGLDRAAQSDVIAEDARLYERVAVQVQELGVPLLRVDTSQLSLAASASHVWTWLAGIGR